MPDQDAVVGKVAIKVLPDTDDFRKKVKKQVEAELAGYKPELKIEITDAREEARRAREEAEAELAKKLTLKVDLGDTGDVIRGIAEIDAALAALRRTTIEIDLDEDSLNAVKRDLLEIDNADFSRLKDEIDSAFDNIELKPTLTERDKQKFKREVDNLYSRIDALKVRLQVEDLSDRERARIENQIGDLHEQLQVSIDQHSLAAAEAELDAAARDRKIAFKVKVESAGVNALSDALIRLSGTRAASNLLQDVVKWAAELDREAPKVGAVAVALLNLTSVAGVASTNILSLVGSIGQIAPAALTLPGILGGLAIGVGITGVAFADFSNQLPEVGARLSKLKDAIRTNFWAEAREPMREFINTLLPQFSAGVKSTSTALGGYFAQLSTSFKNVFNGELQGMFTDLNSSITIFSGHTDSLVGIVRTLGEVGAGYLPQLATYFGNALDNLDKFLTTNKNNGNLFDWIDTGITNLRALGRGLFSTVTAIGGLSKAALDAGGVGLPQFADGMKKLSDSINSDAVQTRLVALFSAMRNGMDALTTGAGPGFKRLLIALSDTLTTALPLAGEAAGKALGALSDALARPALQHALVDLLSTMSDVVDELTPALAPLSDAIASLEPTVSALDKAFGRTLANVIKQVAPALTDLAKPLPGLIDSLNELINDVISGAGPILDGFARTVGGIASALTPVVQAVDLLVKAFGLLPAPLKDATGNLIGIGAAIIGAQWLSSLVLGKVNAFATGIVGIATNTKMSSTEIDDLGNKATTSVGKLDALKASAGQLAGAAGFGLLISATQTQNDALSSFQFIAGGALAGFAIGGPVGAGVGAVAGGFAALAKATSDSSLEFIKYKAPADSIIATLDKVTGATTAATKALAFDTLNKSGAFDNLKSLDELVGDVGLSQRDLVQASLGSKDAIDKFNKAMLESLDATKDTDNYDNVSDAWEKLAAQLRVSGGDIQKASKDTRDLYYATAPLKTILEGFPKGVRTEIKTDGYPTALAQVVDMKRQYDLTPKEVTTIMQASGVDYTLGDVERLINKYNLTPKEIATLVKATGVPDAQGSIEILTNKAEALGHLIPNVSVTADTGAATGALAAVAAGVGNVDGLKVKISAADAFDQLLHVRTDVAGLNTTTAKVTIGAKDQATPKILDLTSALGTLSRDPATVTLKAKDNASPTFADLLAKRLAYGKEQSFDMGAKDKASANIGIVQKARDLLTDKTISIYENTYKTTYTKTVNQDDRTTDQRSSADAAAGDRTTSATSTTIIYNAAARTSQFDSDEGLYDALDRARSFA